MLFKIKREIKVPDEKVVDIPVPAFYRSVGGSQYAMICENGSLITGIVGRNMCFYPKDSMFIENEISNVINTYEQTSEEDFLNDHKRLTGLIERSMNLIPA